MQNDWTTRTSGSPFIEEGVYQPWQSGSKGLVRDFRVIPSKGSDQPIWYIPYLQNIGIRLEPDYSRLCLICHGTGQLVLIEGRGLDDLADQISAKRVQSLHVWDGTHTNQPDKIITAIKVENTDIP